jgi:formylmethanofuran dehydrogenase subunit E-like metal-binding protein
LSGIHVGVHGKLKAVLIDFKHNWNEYRIAVIKNIKLMKMLSEFLKLLYEFGEKYIKEPTDTFL